MSNRFLAGLASVTVLAALAGCGTHRPPAEPPRASPPVPPGWVRHLLPGVSLAAPAGWHLTADRICGSQPAESIGVYTDNAAGGGIPLLGVTNCPSEGSGPAEPAPASTAPASTWVAVLCVIAPRVALGGHPAFVATAGAPRLTRPGPETINVIGRGQAVEVTAGTSPVAQSVLDTVTPTGRHC